MLALTGATGFIGRYLMQSVPDAKVLTRNVEVARKWPNAVEGDLLNARDRYRFVQGCSTLIHLACTSNPRYPITHFSADLEQNLIPTAELFETYARLNPEGHIIFASTGGNMYDDETKIAHTEEEVPKPRSSYAVHKLAAEHHLRLIAASYGIRATILRISNPYGTLLPKERGQGLIGIAFSKLLAEEPVTLFDAKETLRDYIHLEDIAKCFLAAVEKAPDAGTTRLLNVSSGVGTSIAELLALAESITGLKFKIECAPESNHKRPSYSILCNSKAQHALQWQPQIPLEVGLQTTWQLCQSKSLSYA